MIEKLKFKISAGLKDIIGKELITDNDIAIFELVKNSYDAEATKVKIIFENLKNTSKENTRIIIIDDGKGMQRKEIIDKWLFVGYSDKKKFPHETDYRHKIKKRKRNFAGYKGIGRFSADRLGYTLKIYTKTSDKSEIHFVQIDWRKFEKDQSNKFETVNVDYDRVDKSSLAHLPVKNFSKGTILEISPLRDDWDAVKLVRLKKYLRKLINPSYDPENQDFKIDLIANEFKEEDKKTKNSNDAINGPIRNLVFEKLDLKTTQIHCKIKDDEITTELTDKGKFVYKLKEKLEPSYHKLNNISIKLFYLNPNAKRLFTTIMGLEPVKFGSILLYKNSFRIHPYGDEGDDWLGLEKRKTQGTKRYISTREVIGRIEIYGSQSGFIEVSSRSGGVVTSPEYVQLKKFFITQILRKLERYVVSAINWDTEDVEKQKTENEIKKSTLSILSKLIGKKVTTDLKYNSSFLTIFREQKEENMNKVIKDFETMKKYAKSPKEKAQINRHIKEIKNITKVLTAEVKKQQKKVEKLEKEKYYMSKELSDKLQLENLYHHIKLSSKRIQIAIIKINHKIKNGYDAEKIIPLVDDISKYNQKIKSLVNILKFAKFNIKGTKITGDIVMYIKEYITKIVERPSLYLNCNFYHDDFTLNHTFIPMDVSLILDNLIDNADKSGANNISLSFKKEGKNLLMYFGDDGKGINNKYVENIFVRGFSTTNDSGIGLHHIIKILESQEGHIIFLGNNKNKLGRGACFEVMLKSL